LVQTFHDEDSLFITFELACRSYGPEIIDKFITEFLSDGLIEKDVLGFITVKNWEKYQNSALSTPRVQEHRENKRLEQDITDVVTEFNNITGKGYRAKTESYRSKIRARFADGYTKADMVAVIQHKFRDWVGTKHEKYLTPDTLFRPGHFDRYLNEIPKGEKKASAEGKMLKVKDFYGNESHITQDQFDAAEDGFYKIVE
jgi:uncharacterized phage protein (TIGR02220 family)